MALFAMPQPKGTELIPIPHAYRSHVPTEALLTPEGAYEVFMAGKPSGKTTVVCHGLPGDATGAFMPLRYGRNMLSAFCRDVYLNDMNVVCVGRQGCGLTPRQAGRSVASTGESMLYALRCLGIDEFNVLGRSGGCGFACGLASAALSAELVADEPMPRVRRLALLAPGAPVCAFDSAEGWLAGFSPANRMAFKAALERDEHTVRRVYEELRQSLSQNPYALVTTMRHSKETLAADRKVLGNVALAKIIGRGHASPLRRRIDGCVDDLLALATDWDGVDFVSLNTLPGLVVYSPEDPFAPAAHALGLAALIGSSVELKREEGHLATYGLPENASLDQSYTVAGETFSWLNQTFDYFSPARQK